MKNYFLVSMMSIFIFINCSDKSTNDMEEILTMQGVLNSFIDFELREDNGNNLLSKEDYTIDVIYFDNKGKEHIFYNEDLGDPKGYRYDSKSNSVRLYLEHPNWNAKVGKHTVNTLVRFNKGELKVFKCEFKVIRGNISKQKIWLNDKLIWHNELENPVKSVVLIR